MRAASSGSAISRPNSNQWLVLLAILGLTLLVLFSKSFEPHQILFDNDTPLGTLKAEQARLPERFLGTWYNTAWLGGPGPAAAPTITAIVASTMPRELFLKIYPPLTLLLVGFSAWFFFRQLKFNPTVCVLGGLAAGLNNHFLSVACWGTGMWNMSVSMVFLALSALSTRAISQLWAKAILAGLAVGMGVMEGFDVGAILSVFAGAYAVVWFLSEEGNIGARIGRAALGEFLVAGFALFIAIHTISNLVTTQIEGVSSMGQDEQTKVTRWNSATQWSLPKAETLQLVAPGLFGYRMRQHILHPDHSSAYWGGIGRDPRIDGLASNDPEVRRKTALLFNIPEEYRQQLNTQTRHERTAPIANITKKAGIYWRYSGSGEFVGILVTLLAFFALANFRRAQSPFTKQERVMVIFWGMVALFTVLASWGRYGFLYKILYHLPFVSMVRNPIKFLTPFHLGWLILAVYGMEALYRLYVRTSTRRADFLPDHLQQWWAKAVGFEKKWMYFIFGLLGLSIVALFVLNAERSALSGYMEDQAVDPAEAIKMAGFSITHAMWFVVYLAVSVGAIACIVSGAWAGKDANWAWIIIGLIMVTDLVRADVPWIRYFDYTEKYSMNPIVDFLKDRPFDHRIIGKLEPRGPGSGITPGLGELYFFWIQNDFPYHNIQSLDFSQAPHLPDIDTNYLKAFELKGTDIRETDLFPAIRLWQLTNTRFIMSTANGVDLLNQRGRAFNAHFHIHSFYNQVRKPDILQLGDVGDLTVEEANKGAFAMIEFDEALPRVKLYSNWTVVTNNQDALQILSDRAFDPEKVVLVSPDTPVPAAAASGASDDGTATIADYHPKYVKIQADAKTQSVLLFNDRISPGWVATVDKQPVKVLRCNYIMRGVVVPAGSHTVEFRYKPSLNTLFVTLCAIGCGIAVAGYLVATRGTTAGPIERPRSQPSPVSAPTPSPAKAPAPAPVKAPEPSLKAAAPSANPQKSGGKKKSRK
ncbi:MAG TPA: hypothetical protein VGO67_21545 [Verrucomicrobiae bacterium]|jgi:hypothetical protein